jgi:hypothetical protein
MIALELAAAGALCAAGALSVLFLGAYALAKGDTEKEERGRVRIPCSAE